jgi:hypothetical protein
MISRILLPTLVFFFKQMGSYENQCGVYSHKRHWKNHMGQNASMYSKKERDFAVVCGICGSNLENVSDDCS